jgi:hypothetical protein
MLGRGSIRKPSSAGEGGASHRVEVPSRARGPDAVYADRTRAKRQANGEGVAVPWRRRAVRRRAAPVGRTGRARATEMGLARPRPGVGNPGAAEEDDDA